MPNQNKIILVGRLVADPESRSTVEGLPLARFSLAVSRPTTGQGEAVDYINIVAWRKLAEICGQYLKKGRLVLVEGRIQNRSFEDQSGQRKWVTEVVANNMTMLDGKNDGRETMDDGRMAKKEAELVPDEEELSSDLPF